MEHLALEILDYTGTGSKFATLPRNTRIHVRRTSQIFGKGNVWTHEFSINIHANAHIFGTSGELHGARLHEQINKRRARLWVEGIPLYYGYLRLANEVDVDADGNVGITFESGSKTFEDMLDGLNAQDVSVGDVVIGVALNRKRDVMLHIKPSPKGEMNYTWKFTLGGLTPLLAGKSADIKRIGEQSWPVQMLEMPITTWRTVMWPKMVIAHGRVQEDGIETDIDYTNIQTPYDEGHPFCNINICYPYKSWDADGNEQAGRGYILRSGRSNKIQWSRGGEGGDGETRYNDAPNFYLLYWLKRLFMDLGIHVEENQMEDVEDLRRVFMLNFGCHYEELDTDINIPSSETPQDKIERYGAYKMRMFQACYGRLLVRDNEPIGKVLARNIRISKDGEDVFVGGSVEGTVTDMGGTDIFNTNTQSPYGMALDGYLAYATGENYPKVEAADVISAVESAFGVRFIFNDNFSRVRIILLRNIFKSSAINELGGGVMDPTKQENCIRGFRMTYGAGEEDTHFYYKGLNDMLDRDPDEPQSTKDKHDYSQWDINADYADILRKISAFNRTCYIVSRTGNAYVVKVDENESVLFPTLFETAGFMDAQDGNCADKDETVETVSVNAKPLLMNKVNGVEAVLFGGEMNAPTTATEAQVNQPFTQVAAQAYLTTKELTYTYSGYTLRATVDFYFREGYKVRLADNYNFSNGGISPFDTAEPGLQFGIMRSSGDEAYIQYLPDDIGDEGNDWWESVPGAGAIDHPDTCDDYGNLWDYNGQGKAISNAGEAQEELATQWPNSNAPLYDETKGYLTMAVIFRVMDADGNPRRILFAAKYSNAGSVLPGNFYSYLAWLSGRTPSAMMRIDRSLLNLIIEIGSNQERCDTLIDLCEIAYGGSTTPIYVNNGVGSLYGRFSMKLRAEKPNPMFDASQPESDNNRRYLEITNPNLRGRGLADQFYKEYSYWIRNARVANAKKPLNIAQLSTLDDTVRVRIGDVTGFLKELEFDVDMQTGLSPVTMKVMYI